MGWTLLVTAGVAQAATTLALSAINIGLATDIREGVLQAEVGPPELGHREVLVLQSHNGLIPFAMASTWAIETGDRDLHVRTLQMGRRGLRWTRIDARTFELESLDEPFLNLPFERVYLAEDTPPTPGQRWETPLFTVEATKTDAKGLRAFRVRFAEDPDQPRFRFLVSREGRLVATRPPRVGESLEIPRIVPPSPFVP